MLLLLLLWVLSYFITWLKEGGIPLAPACLEENIAFADILYLAFSYLPSFPFWWTRRLLSLSSSKYAQTFLGRQNRSFLLNPMPIVLDDWVVNCHLLSQLYRENVKKIWIADVSHKPWYFCNYYPFSHPSKAVSLSKNFSNCFLPQLIEFSCFVKISIFH